MRAISFELAEECARADAIDSLLVDKALTAFARKLGRTRKKFGKQSRCL